MRGSAHRPQVDSQNLAGKSGVVHHSKINGRLSAKGRKQTSPYFNSRHPDSGHVSRVSGAIFIKMHLITKRKTPTLGVGAQFRTAAPARGRSHGLDA
jgi:hypothetical protein